MNEFLGLMITELVISFSLILVGYFIKKTKSGDLVSGFDPKLDDKEKIAILFGNGMVLLGIINFTPWILLAAIFYMIELSTMIFLVRLYIGSTVFIIFIMCGKLYYRMIKYRRSNNNKGGNYGKN